MAWIWLAGHGPRPVGNELAEATDLSDPTVTRALGRWRKGWTNFRRLLHLLLPPPRRPPPAKFVQRERDFYGQQPRFGIFI